MTSISNQLDLAAAMGAATLVANLEVLAMATKARLPLPRVIEVINRSTGRSHVSAVELPSLIQGEAGHAFEFSRVLGCLERTLSQAAALRVPLPIMGYALSTLMAARNVQGTIGNSRDVAHAIAALAGASLSSASEQADAAEKAPTSGPASNVGYIGLGVMGEALARQALQVARAVYVHDVRPDSTAALVSQGARYASDLAAMARNCDIIFICVPGSKEVRSVIFGAHGLAPGLTPGQVIVDQTTGSPAETRALAGELAMRGVSLVDAPIAGGPQGVAAGNFLSFCGGTPRAASMAQQMLQSMGSQVVNFGDVGNGHAAKLVKNAMAICNRFVAYEGLSVAVGLGMSLDDLARGLAGGWGDTAAIERLLLAKHTGTPSATIRLELLAKDQALICALGRDVVAPMGVANLIRAGVVRACRELGGNANIDDIGKMFGLRDFQQ